MLIQLLFKLVNWALPGIDAKAYTSPTPVGKRLGGHDIQQIADLYLIIDIRFKGKILLLGYFQFS